MIHVKLIQSNETRLQHYSLFSSSNVLIAAVQSTFLESISILTCLNNVHESHLWFSSILRIHFHQRCINVDWRCILFNWHDTVVIYLVYSIWSSICSSLFIHLHLQSLQNQMIHFIVLSKNFLNSVTADLMQTSNESLLLMTVSVNMHVQSQSESWRVLAFYHSASLMILRS